MRRKQLWAAMHGLCVALTFSTGCLTQNRFSISTPGDTSYFQNFATRIEYPDVQSSLDPSVTASTAPMAFENPANIPTWDLSLQEAVELAMRNSEIMRSLGGSVVQSPGIIRTNYDPALTEANPLGGVEAALSQFDATWQSQLFWQKNNRPNNTLFLVFLPAAQEQTLGVFNAEIAKTTALGTRFALRHNVTYDRNNSPQRLFPSDFVGFFEAEMRQPLMQGGGATYNRIAGPNSLVGQYNGVLIARINTDISLTDFESGVVQLVNDVEGAYWELHFAYRNLEAQLVGRDGALGIWQRGEELQKAGAVGGEVYAILQAKGQFYRFDALVKDAQAGINGLFATEQRLRYLMGLPPSDGRLIRPITDPVEASVVFDWESALGDALTQRVEIRRQKWNIKRRELELIAARLNKRPRLDALTQYRWRGLGDNLLGQRDPNNSFDNLYQNIGEGDFQEWQAGFEMNFPIGLRQASVAITHAQLNLSREQAVLNEQELRISHDLTNVARDVRRNHELLLVGRERLQADLDWVRSFEEFERVGAQQNNQNATDLKLRAQQSLVVSQQAFFRTLADYNLSLRDLHREKGSLLAYNQVALAESAWPAAAYGDAMQRGRFLTPRHSPEKVQAPRPISEGGFDPSAVGAPGLGMPATMNAEPVMLPPQT